MHEIKRKSYLSPELFMLTMHRFLSDASYAQALVVPKNIIERENKLKLSHIVFSFSFSFLFPYFSLTNNPKSNIKHW